MIKIVLTLSLVALCFCGCSTLLARTPQLSTSKGLPGTPPKRGLGVTKVFPNSPAEAAGIQPMDLITQYGEFQIVDKAGFFAAKNHYEKSLIPTVEIIVWRGVYRTVKVRSGWLGVSTVEHDKVSGEFDRLMGQINAKRALPEYMYDREFKGLFTESESDILKNAKALIDQAEQEGSLTPAQILVARIYMVLDDAAEDDLRRQRELLKELLETQPVNYIHMLGNDKFFADKRYRAAIVCFNHYLKTEPDDVSIRLNMALAYNRVGMYEEGERAADYVFDHNLGLSKHGHVVAYQAKAEAALGRKDYRKSIDFAEKVFSLNQVLYPLMLELLAAAQLGDREIFQKANQKIEQTLPAIYIEKKLEIDAVDAYALVKTNQSEAARKLVSHWRQIDRVEKKVISFWRKFPGGMDVARNWSDLMKN